MLRQLEELLTKFCKNLTQWHPLNFDKNCVEGIWYEKSGVWLALTSARNDGTGAKWDSWTRSEPASEHSNEEARLTEIDQVSGNLEVLRYNFDRHFDDSQRRVSRNLRVVPGRCLRPRSGVTEFICHLLLNMHTSIVKSAQTSNCYLHVRKVRFCHLKGLLHEFWKTKQPTKQKASALTIYINLQ